MACLDTSAILDLSGRSGAKRRKDARKTIRSLASAGEHLVTTRFTIAELWVGIERSRDKSLEKAKVEKLIEPLAVLEFDHRAAMVFGRILAHLQKEGTPIGDMDSLISAVCLTAGYSIVTRNGQHFSRVPAREPALEVIEY